MLTACNKFSLAVFILSTSLGCLGVHAADKPPASGPASGRLIIAGAGTMEPLVAEVARRFSERRPGLQIEVRGGGSLLGVDEVMAGKADIGMVSRPLTDKESNLYSFAIARDGVCLIVHKDNPIRSLSRQQVADIFTGRINNWKGVGGNNAPIETVTVPEGRGGADLFTHYFGIKYADIKARVVRGGNPERLKVILDNPNSIAHVSVGWAQKQTDANTLIRLLPVDGVAATVRNIRAGNFPISRPLLLITREAPTGLVKEFINFSLSSQVTDIVLRLDLVPYLD